MTKEELRQIALERRNKIKLEERSQWSEVIWQQLKDMEEFWTATHVLSYASFRSEVDTKQIQDSCWRQGKHIYLPKTNSMEKTMSFYEVTSVEDLARGYQGIWEPVTDTLFLPDNKSREDRLVMIMPGVAFDEEGNRIGYGGGYYDRYLQQYGEYIDVTILLAFEEQKVTTIPAEQCDIRPMKIVTNCRR